MAPAFSLASLPMQLPLDHAPGEAGHEALSRALCAGATAALGLPEGLSLDARENYAHTACCSFGAEAPPVSVRLRVLGICPGKNAKKKFEYLGVSFVALDANGRVVRWSEDLFAHTEGGTPASVYWAAVDAGRPLPKAKRRAADCALLSFVTVNGSARTLAPITEELRALVARSCA